MRLLSFCLLLLPVSVAFCQEPADSSEPPPPAVDQALRARANQFYSAYVSGKWRDAFAVVADDMQDTYLEASKDTFSHCELVKITYAESFTKATVHENCLGEYRWHNSHIPVTVPLTSTWKVVDGQWYWYYIKPTEVMTPWGVSIGGPETPKTPGAAAIEAKVESVLKDPAALARAILSQVKVDKSEIHLLGYQTSKDVLNITNTLPGVISVDVNCPLPPGFHITPTKTEIGPNQTAAIAFVFDSDDAKKQCGECARLAKPKLTAWIRISPTSQSFPVKITFAIPPELEKQLPKELRAPADKR